MSSAQLDDALDLLGRIVDAFDQPYGESAHREKILVARSSAGTMLHHHAIRGGEIDEALIDELIASGLLDYDYVSSGNSRLIWPTADGRAVVGQIRAVPDEIDSDGFAQAVFAAKGDPNPLGWHHGLGVLRAMSECWQALHFPPEGIPAAHLVSVLDESDRGLATALIGALLQGGYLEPASMIGAFDVPMFVRLSDRARGALDGWPSSDPQVVYAALLSSLDEAVEKSTDATTKRRLETARSAIREIGVATMSDILARTIVGQ